MVPKDKDRVAILIRLPRALKAELDLLCRENQHTINETIEGLIREAITGQPSITTIHKDLQLRFFATYAELEQLHGRTLQIYIAVLEQAENSLRLFFSGKPMPGNVLDHLTTLARIKTGAMEEYTQKQAQITESSKQLVQIGSQQKAKEVAE